MTTEDRQQRTDNREQQKTEEATFNCRFDDSQYGYGMNGQLRGFSNHWPFVAEVLFAQAKTDFKLVVSFLPSRLFNEMFWLNFGSTIGIFHLQLETPVLAIPNSSDLKKGSR